MRISPLRLRWMRLAAAITAVVLTTNILADPAIAKPLVFHAPALQATTQYPRVNTSYTATHLRSPQALKRADTSWPQPASATVALTPGGATSVGGATSAATPSGTRTAASSGLTASMPITLSPVSAVGAASQRSAVPAPSAANVRVLAHAQASAAGVAGVIFTLAPVAGDAAGAAKVGVDYASFRNAGGADYADRLRLVRLPACALTTPSVAACRVQTPLASNNDGAHTTVSARVDLPAGSPGSAAASPDAVAANQAIVLGVAPGPSGSNGDFTATATSPAGSWSAGGASGDFNWSYPISVPAAAAGPTPQVGLNYSSADVDGRTATTNNQFGPIGEGFTLSSSYIARSYNDCADDPEGAIANDYDNCWAGQVVSMSLNGQSTTLIVDANGVWHAQAENGDLIQYETGTAADTGNGTYDNGYWIVTAVDGTKYFFGKNKGPGWASGNPTTNSAWTEPVYGAHPGDPCYSQAGFAQSSCSQAWQWNLDFVIDPHGNTAAYYYTPEVGYYGADNQSTPVAYDRSGYPTEIDYGMRDENGTIYGATAPRKVLFGTAPRCFGDSTTCAFTSTNTTPWDDTPVDQICPSTGSCSYHSPTFYSEYRIIDISTAYYPAGSTTPVTVDDYALGQSFSDAGDSELLLNSITRTAGPAGSSSDVPLPAVSLEYQMMDNRIPGYNSEPAMSHWRLTNIESETGEIIAVAYSTSCTTAQIPSDPSQNTSQCYPVKWTPEGIGSTNPILDYFNKYVVTQVADSNAQQQVVNGTPQPLTPTQITKYAYPSGAVLWHYDDNQLVKSANRTYGQFRGYPEVDSYTGDTADTSANGTLDQQTETKTFYYRGMNGDQLPAGATRAASVTDTLGDTYVDDNAFADQVLETESLTGVNGSEVKAAITTLAVTATTGSMGVSGLPTLYADMVAPSQVREITDLAAGGTETKTTKTTYDAAGRAVLVDVSGTNIAESCTQTDYAGPVPNPNASPPTPAVWITRAVAEAITASGPCPTGSGAITTANILRDTRTYYDGSALGAAPTVGNATTVSKAVGATGGSSLTFKTQSTNGYDAMGRITSTADALGHPTTISYTPADGGIVTAESTTNALGQSTNSTYDPPRGSRLSTTDVSGYLTSAAYDALGRLTAVWKPGRSQANRDAANVTYSYLVSQKVPNALTTNTLVDYGTGTNYLTSVAIDDGRGQTVQTQTAADGGGVTVADAFYDSHGWKVAAWGKYYTTGSPSTTEVSAQQADFNDVSTRIYDTAGRAVEAENFNGTTLTSSAQTVNGGDRVTVIEHDPAGAVIGTPTTTVSDVDGNTIETGQYTAAPAVNGNVVVPAPGSTMQATTTTYDAAGLKTKVTDPAANAWSYTYDLQGRRTQSVDPDTGTSTTTYDADGNVASNTDANGTADNYVYDVLGRKSAQYTGSTTQGSGKRIATWNYDTLVPGKFYYETSTNPVTGLTYQTGVTGYDAAGNTAGTWVTIPKTGATAGLGGTYTTTYSYTTTGLMTYDDPAVAGGLPSEDIDYTYDQYSNLQTEGLHAYDVYADGASYSPYGQLTQIKLGSGPSAGSLSYNYDPQTGQETLANLSVTAPVPQIDNVAYAYNADRQLVSSTDTEGGNNVGAPVETQCYTYDILDRLSAAWSATDNCAANPFTSNSNATVGGPQPYAQAWTFDALGDRKSEIDMPAAGATSGTTTTTYTYATPGHAHALTSTSSSNTVTGPGAGAGYGYDNAGQTISRASGAESLTWTPTGQLQSDTVGSAGSSFIYDADGNLLIESDTSTNSETLFLPGEQITYNTGNGAKSGIRYYSFCGVSIAESTGTAGALYWLAGNVQGTASVAVNAFHTATITRRLLTPYGGKAAGSAAWIDPRSFLGDQQTSTGLIDIGAREYDPALGVFLSVDPVLDSGTPQSMTGYEYADDNPVGKSDPTGMDPGQYGTGVGGGAPDCGIGCDVGEFNGNGPTSNGCVVTATNGCGGTGLAALNAAIARDTRHERALKGFLTELKGCQDMAGWGADCELASVRDFELADGQISLADALAELLGGLPLAFLAGGDAGDEEDPAASGSLRSLEQRFDELIGKDDGQAIDAAVSSDISAVEGKIAEERAAVGCLTQGGQSFTPGTLVLTASGKAVPIAALKVGDKVQAFDTATGRKTVETVEAVLVNRDSDLYDLTVSTPHGPQTIHTTANHPVWEPAAHAWVTAGNLPIGEHLLTADATSATVAGGTIPQDPQGWMWDLTITTDHDFYVLAGDTPVLVHNDGNYYPAPNTLPGFPKAKKVKPMSPRTGGGGLRARWQDGKNILEWDYQHGAVEMYNSRGQHLGEFDPLTGAQTKDAVKGRTCIR